MSSPPDYIQIDPGQMKTVQDVGSVVVGPQNKFNEQAYTLFNGNLTFQDNVKVPNAATTFKTPSNYSDGQNANFTAFTFLAQNSNVSCVLIGQITDTGSNTPMLKPVFITSWTQSNSGQVTVNYMTGLTAGHTYKVTFLAL